MATNTETWAGVLMVIGGLVLAVPTVYDWLSSFTGGLPWIQIVVGSISVVVGIMMLFQK